MNDWERQHRQAQQYKDAYPPGTRLMLLCMNDPHHPVESGTRGTVEHVDDMGTIHMSWDTSISMKTSMTWLHGSGSWRCLRTI